MSEEAQLKRALVRNELEAIEAAAQFHADGTHYLDAEECEVYLRRIDAMYIELKEVLLTLCKKDNAHYDEHLKQHQESSDKLTFVYGVLRRIQKFYENKEAQARQAKGPEQADRKDQRIKLPKIQLPKFDGQPLDWLPFKDMFETSVNALDDVSDAQKFQYLRTQCSGEALRLINHLPITDGNFRIAYTLLQERYENERLILQCMLDKFYKFKPQPTGQSMRSSIDIYNTCLRTIANLGMESEKAVEALLMYHIVSNLDPHTREQWELSLKTRKIPSSKEFIAFMDVKALALDESKPGYSGRKVYVNTTKAENEKRFRQDKSNDKGCPANGCGQKHPLYGCPVFKGMTLNQRMELVNGKRLCYVCFGNHMLSQCKSKHRCNQCNKRHSALLHFEKRSDEAPDTLNFATNGQELREQEA